VLVISTRNPNSDNKNVAEAMLQSAEHRGRAMVDLLVHRALKSP